MRILSRCIGTTLLVIMMGQAPMSSQTTSALQKLKDLSAATSLERDGITPWHLHMTFDLYDLQGKKAESGTIEEWWTSPGNSKLVVTSPSYNLPSPDGQSSATANHANREAYLIRTLLNQVINPIPRYGDYSGLTVKEYERAFGQTKLSCLTVQRADVVSTAANVPAAAQYCVEPNTDELRVAFETGQAAAVRNQLIIFRGIELARENQLSYGGRPAITGHIEQVESYTPDATEPSSESDVESQPVIPGVVLAGKILRSEQPVYPISAKMKHIGGSVVLCAIISRQGTISSLDVVSSPDDSLSKSAVDAVKHWTYQPYLLNGQPTEVDTTITVNYNLNY